MTGNRINDNYVLYMDKPSPCGIHCSDMKHVQKRPDDFKLDLDRIPAFTRRGIWDQDKSEHLNIHSLHQIITVRDGMLLVEDGSVKQPLYRNMAALIPAGKPHLLKVLKKNQEVVCHSLYFDPKLFPGEAEDICVFEMSGLGTALLTELDKENLVDLSMGIKGQCLNLFIEILKQDIQKPAHIIRLPEAEKDRNKKVIDFIHDNYMNKIMLDHFTRVVPLSTRQIARSFQDELKMNIMQYVKLYRLLNASILLHETNRKIIDIAFDCGYDTISHFHEDFKHHFGLSPNNFRKAILQ